MKNQWLTEEILIQTEIDYKIKSVSSILMKIISRIMKKLKQKSISKYKYSIFRFLPAIDLVLLQHENAKRKKLKNQFKAAYSYMIFTTIEDKRIQ